MVLRVIELAIKLSTESRWNKFLWTKDSEQKLSVKSFVTIANGMQFIWSGNTSLTLYYFSSLLSEGSLDAGTSREDCMNTKQQFCRPGSVHSLRASVTRELYMGSSKYRDTSREGKRRPSLGG